LPSNLLRKYLSLVVWIEWATLFLFAPYALN
jgi:hypothetical protein